MSKRKWWTKVCPVCNECYVPDEDTLCHYCLLEKCNLHLKGRYDNCDPEGLGSLYYNEGDVLDAIRKAEEVGAEEAYYPPEFSGY